MRNKIEVTMCIVSKCQKLNISGKIALQHNISYFSSNEIDSIIFFKNRKYNTKSWGKTRHLKFIYHFRVWKFIKLWGEMWFILNAIFHFIYYIIYKYICLEMCWYIINLYCVWLGNVLIFCILYNMFCQQFSWIQGI